MYVNIEINHFGGVKMRFLMCCIFAALFGYVAVCDGTVTDIDADSRNGQVFLAWSESGGGNSSLKVYMSDQQITHLTFDKAVLLTDELEPNSGNDWTVDPSMCPRTAGPARGWILDPAGVPLSVNSGLFVHTVTKDDPQMAFFAVLGANDDASDIKVGVNSLEKAVEISVGDIEAIYQLAEEVPFKKNMPLAVYLHPHTSRPPGEFTHLFFADKTMGWRDGLPFKFKVSVLEDVILVEPYDRVWINRIPGAAEASQSYDRQYKHIESWWYGTNDKINSPKELANGIAVNYTERILLWMIGWVQKTYNTDPAKVYGFGVSMGTGIQRFALNYPNVFASVDVLVPIIDLKYEMELEEGNIKRTVAAVGPLDRLCSDGMPLSERFDLVKVAGSVNQDLPFIVLRLGRQDHSVGWNRKPEYVKCMQQQRNGILVGWDNGEHTTSMLKPIERFPVFRDYKWHTDRFALNKSYPAFSNFSLNDNMGNGSRTDGDLEGFVNYGLDWQIIKDESRRYEILITSKHAKAPGGVVDITPRRRQLFRPLTGGKVIAVNQTLDGKVVDKTMLTVDEFGNITYKGFKLTDAKGNKMTLVVKP